MRSVLRGHRAEPHVHPTYTPPPRPKWLSGLRAYKYSVSSKHSRAGTKLKALLQWASASQSGRPCAPPLYLCVHLGVVASRFLTTRALNSHTHLPDVHKAAHQRRRMEGPLQSVYPGGPVGLGFPDARRVAHNRVHNPSRTPTPLLRAVGRLAIHWYGQPC